MACANTTQWCNWRVRAWLRAPVVCDEWLPLDGVLLYQQTRADMGRREATLSGASALEQPKGDEMRGGRLPIKIVHAKDWYYRCSWAQWGPHADGRDFWNKRLDQSLVYLVDFDGRRGRIDTSAATYKSYHMPMFYRAALWVEWYLAGDMEALRPLILATTHLGKKTAQGWGRVARWEIKQAGEDWSIWQAGRLMRGIPFYHLPKGQAARNPGSYGVRPPYWDQRNQMTLEMPVDAQPAALSPDL